MSQISPKQIDWSQQISGSLIPYVSGGETVSNFSLGSPSSSWGSIYIGRETIITGSVKISGSLEVIGISTFDSQKINEPSVNIAGQLNMVNQYISSSVQRAKITIENLGEVGNRDSGLVLDLGGFF